MFVTHIFIWYIESIKFSTEIRKLLLQCYMICLLDKESLTLIAKTSQLHCYQNHEIGLLSLYSKHRGKGILFQVTTPIYTSNAHSVNNQSCANQREFYEE